MEQKSAKEALNWWMNVLAPQTCLQLRKKYKFGSRKGISTENIIMIYEKERELSSPEKTFNLNEMINCWLAGLNCGRGFLPLVGCDEYFKETFNIDIAPGPQKVWHFKGASSTIGSVLNNTLK